MVTEKEMLTLDQIDREMALDLPERETPVTVVIGCVICIGQIRIRVEDVNVAAQICAAVNALSNRTDIAFTCDIRQN